MVLLPGELPNFCDQLVGHGLAHGVKVHKNSKLNHLAKDHSHEGVDADDLHLLLLLCKDVADSAGSFLGITKAQSAEEPIGGIPNGEA